jgi:hypothetical protein
VNDRLIVLLMIELVVEVHRRGDWLRMLYSNDHTSLDGAPGILP